jgi:hypothetical protein
MTWQPSKSCGAADTSAEAVRERSGVFRIVSCFGNFTMYCAASRKIATVASIINVEGLYRNSYFLVQ